MGSSSGGSSSSKKSNSSSPLSPVKNAFNDLKSYVSGTTTNQNNISPSGTGSVYRTNDPATQQKIDNFGRLYNEAMGRGDTTSAQAYHTAANQLRDSMGGTGKYNPATGESIGYDEQSTQTPTNDYSYGYGGGIAYQAVEPVPTEYINELKEAQRQSRIASLDKARSAAISSLDTEKANVAPTYYDKRNQAAAASDVGAMNFAQYMAARGIKGAAGAMPEVYRNAGLQGQIGALDRQEAGNLAAIERQRSNINTGYESDVAAANADVESQAMEMLINQWNQNRTYQLQQAAADLDRQQFDWSKSPSNPDYQASVAAARAAELNNAAQEIQNSYLPETLKLQAQRLKQQVDAGQYDADQALAQLNQIKAQAANYGRSGGSSGGSEASSQKAMNDWVTKQVAADDRLLPDYSNYQQLYDAWKTMYINNMGG